MTAETDRTAPPVEILLVEDNLADARLTREALKEGKVEVVSRRDKKARAVPVPEALATVRSLRAELAGASGVRGLP